MQDPEFSLEKALERFVRLIHADPALVEQWNESKQQFFGASQERSGADALAQRRFMEWFVLERHSASLLGTPVDKLLIAWRLECPSAEVDSLEDLEHALQSSFTGVFEVGDVRPGAGAWLRDMAGFGDFALAEPKGSIGLNKGDLMVGRLFPLGGGVHHSSRSAALFQNPTLIKALEADLNRLREAGGQNIRHLSAPDLEIMFWGAGSIATPEEPVKDARQMLVDAGVLPEIAEGYIRQLGQTAFDSDRLSHGGQDMLGEILDELAFDTNVDLAAARTALTHAWAGLGPRPEAVPKTAEEKNDPDGDPDVARESAVNAFAAGRAAGQDIEELFNALEEELELGEEDPDEDPGDALDFPGVIDAMIAEFRWELKSGGDPEASAHASALAELARFGQSIGVFEELDHLALLRFTTFWLPEQGRLRKPAEVTAALNALDAFCAWAQDAHEMPLANTFREHLGTLRGNLPRIIALRDSVQPASANDEDSGELYEVRAVNGAEVTLASRKGNETAVELDADLCRGLQSADRLRARIALDGSTRVFCVYPPEAALLLQS
ncbi:MAG: hypothetical protein ACI8QC_000689 [Planctomycetota bacterium]|jgi:hypothetical protein